MNKTYTVLAYKSSGSTSCRGCTMDEWGSDFEFQVFDDVDEAIKYAAGFKAINMNEDSYGSYDITFLVNGQEYYYYDFEWGEDPNLDSRSSLLAKEIDDARKAKKEQARLDKIREEHDRKVASDLKLLAKLQQTYGEQK